MLGIQCSMIAMKLYIAIQFTLFSREALGSNQPGEDSRLCLRVAENEVYQPALKPRTDSCKGWFCWQSQLTITAKTAITRIVNKFRNREAQNVLNMNKLVWHWALEHEALRASEICLREHLEMFDFKRNIDGLGFQLKCEYGCIKETHTLHPSQIIFIQLLKDALPKNGLGDFDGDGKFRRGNAMYFGCALVVRTAVSESENAYEDIYHFVCVFCTTENTMMSIHRNTSEDKPLCPPKSEYGGDKSYLRLCDAENRNSIYMCAPIRPCPVDDEVPVIWQAPDPGITTEMIMLETNKGALLLLNKTTVKGLDEKGLPIRVAPFLLFDNDGEYLNVLSYYPSLPKHVFLYPPNRLSFYNTAAQSLMKDVQVKNPTILEKVIVYRPEEAVDGNQDAWCCGLLLGLSCIPTVILIITIYYTVKKNRIS